MTNAEKLKTMDTEQLADLLACSPWTSWFAMAVCKKCGKKKQCEKLCRCLVADGDFEVIEMWLKAEEQTNGNY